MNSQDLLPPNATALERAIARVCAASTDIPVPLRDLVDAYRCPPQLLPYLAWACSVDRWDPVWPVPVKRAAVAASYQVHALKGTVAALRRVVEPIGNLIEVAEWWQQEPPGEPGTFSLLIGITDRGIDAETYAELERLIADAKPASRHLTALDLIYEPQLTARHNLTVLEGDVLEVFPWSSHA